MSSALRTLLLPLVIAGCSESGWRQASVEELAPDDAGRLESARAATQLLGQRLMGTLAQALEAGGPGAAIVVCRDMAPDFAADVAEETGLAIGRTSFRLRNPQNLAPQWAAATVERRVDAEQLFLGPEGELGLLRPIHAAPLCAQCHGPEQQLDPSAVLALSEHYPTDAATGFEVGDLRGYFWVQAPAR